MCAHARPDLLRGGGQLWTWEDCKSEYKTVHSIYRKHVYYINIHKANKKATEAVQTITVYTSWYVVNVSLSSKSSKRSVPSNTGTTSAALKKHQ